MANQLQLAEAQFIGFHHGKHGFTIKELAKSMGLKKSEWIKIRESCGLSDSEMEEVDELFIQERRKIKGNELDKN